MKLAALFSDHMVLQRDIAIPVWGWAEPGRHVTVEVAGNSAGATAGTDGKWLSIGTGIALPGARLAADL